MIRYTLTCDDGHAFDSWFASAGAFDDMDARGMLSCIVCGSSKVKKSLMAPNVAVSDKRADRGEGAEDSSAVSTQPMAAGPLSHPGSKLEKMLVELRNAVEANSTYVGRDFAQKARDMHLGDAPVQQIHGEATREEARELLEDGVPVMPLPIVPKSKSN